MSKIIITGHTGFVGSNLVPYCTNKGYEPVGMSLRNRSSYSFPENTAAIVHLAGKAHDTSNVADPAEYMKVNFALTKEIFDAFLVSDIPDFIFLSSVKAAQDSVDGLLVEDAKPCPATPYGKSKLAAEEYLLSQQLAAGKRLFILRPCMIHGPGNKGNLNLLYKLVQHGIPYPLAAFDNQRSLLTVENLCFVIVKLLEEKTVPSGIYHVADEKPLSTRQIIRIMKEITGSRSWLLPVNRSIIRAIARIGDVLRLPLNSERLKKLTENYVVSTQKLLNAIGQKLPVESDEGLRTTIRSFGNAG